MDHELEDYERELIEELSDSEEADPLFAKTIYLLRDIIDGAGWDDVTDEIILSAETSKGEKIIERFQSIDEIRVFLDEFGWDDYDSLQGGIERVFGYKGVDRVTERQVDLAVRIANAEELFFKPKSVGKKLFTIPHGLLIPEFKLQLAQVNEELIRYLASHPAMLHSLEPRAFEELVGELFRDLGFEIIVTPRSRDGGVDIRAIQKGSVGTGVIFGSMQALWTQTTCRGRNCSQSLWCCSCRACFVRHLGNNVLFYYGRKGVCKEVAVSVVSA